LWHTINSGTLDGDSLAVAAGKDQITAGFTSQFFAQGNVTIGTYIGFQVLVPKVTDRVAGWDAVDGVVKNTIGLDVPRMTQGTVSNLGARIRTKIQLWDDTTTFAAQPGTMIATPGVYTLSSAATTAPGFLLFNTYNAYSVDGSASHYVIQCAQQYINDGATAGIDFGTITDFYVGPTISGYVRADVTGTLHIAYSAAPTYNTVSSGTLVVAEDRGFSSTLVVTTGATVTLRTGILIGNAFVSGGTVTTQVGIQINALTSGGTNIGLRNASTTVYTPSTQNLTAVTNTISPTATVHEVTLNAAYTLTSTPHIADGQSGQLLILINADSADALTLRDQSAIASNLRLPGAANLVLGPRDTATFIFNSTLGDWICIGTTNN
jgi:hypothetical protein